MNTFKCKACDEIKQTSEFYKLSSVLRGHDSTCKVCRDNNKRKRVAERRAKGHKHKKSYSDNASAAKNTTFDEANARIIKISDDRRNKVGIERIKKKGFISNAIVAKEAKIFKQDEIIVKAIIRADGVQLDYSSENLADKDHAESHIEFIRDNALTIASEKLGVGRYDCIR